MVSDDFIEQCGLPFFAHRLRRLSELFVEQSGTWLVVLGLKVPPRAVSTVLLLAERQPLTITEIAAALRFSHPLIIKLVRDLASLALVRLDQDSGDGRQRLVRLTRRGIEEAERLRQANDAMAHAYRSLFAAANANGLECIERIECAVRDNSLLERLRVQSVPTRKTKK